MGIKHLLLPQEENLSYRRGRTLSHRGLGSCTRLLGWSYLGREVAYHMDGITMINIDLLLLSVSFFGIDKRKGLTFGVLLCSAAVLMPRAFFLTTRGSPLFKARWDAVLLRRRAKDSDERDIAVRCSMD
jgi:hypothetical protein